MPGRCTTVVSKSGGAIDGGGTPKCRADGFCLRHLQGSRLDLGVWTLECLNVPLSFGLSEPDLVLLSPYGDVGPLPVNFINTYHIGPSTYVALKIRG